MNRLSIYVLTIFLGTSSFIFSMLVTKESSETYEKKGINAEIAELLIKKRRNVESCSAADEQTRLSLNLENDLALCKELAKEDVALVVLRSWVSTLGGTAMVSPVFFLIQLVMISLSIRRLYAIAQKRATRRSEEVKI